MTFSPAPLPDLVLIRAVRIEYKHSTGLQRIKIQMDSGAWLYADVPPSAIQEARAR